MNRLLCFLTGGHRYADKNLVAYQSKISHHITLHNECIKCGKPMEFEINVGAIVRAELERLNRRADNG